MSFFHSALLVFFIRYFGTNRAGSVLVPDDISGLPSTHIEEHLASNQDPILYEAEIDVGTAYRCYRLNYLCIFTPWGLAWVAASGLLAACSTCPCDEACCYVRKEYSTRKWYRVHSNRIAVNDPGKRNNCLTDASLTSITLVQTLTPSLLPNLAAMRVPFGVLGCGSWNADRIVTHPFDRGAFGFSRTHCAVINYMCCIWPVYGETVGRHRCQCNGPLWNRMFTDCGM
jgi:hypothetical protein